MSDKKLSEEEVADLKEAFAMFDINGDGKPSFRYDLTSFVASSRGSVPAG
jgi:Ca2+-binding EF-hand superfamily protein